MNQNREATIIRTSILGIVMNVILVAFKMGVGLLANSIAIILDAVNNLSDALSSVITILGTKLAGRKPDKKHPYGYGRVEYLTGVVIAVIVLLAGITSLKESVTKIIHPEETNYSIATVIIVAVAVLVKFFMGRYVKSVGNKVNSSSLIASGADALFDSILSLATLVAAIVSMVWGIGLEGILGAVISLIILKAGIEMLMETVGNMIGNRADSELSAKLKEKVTAYPEVKGAYDLALHNYGPTEIIGSVHVELPDDMTAREIHKLTRMIATDVFMEFGIILTVGIYASNTGGAFADLKEKVDAAVKRHPEILQIHGFYAEEETHHATFDLVVDFKANAEEVKAQVEEELKETCPAYRFDIILDSDYSD